MITDGHLILDLRASHLSLVNHTSVQPPAADYKWSQVEIEDALAFGEQGLILQSDGEVALNSILYANSIDHIWDGNPYRATAFAIAPRHRRPGRYLFLDGLWSQYFWHFMLEYLPRALGARDSEFDGHYVLGTHQPKFCTEALKLLEIPQKKILFRPHKHHWWVESALLPIPITGTAGHNRPSLREHPELLVRLRDAFLSSVADDDESSIGGLYISRANSTRGRRILNEEELTGFLNRIGFETMRMEDHSLRDQIRRVKRSYALIGAHGAGMLHSLFMPEGAKIVEIMVPSHERDTNKFIHEMLNQTHITLKGVCGDAIPLHESDISVPLDSFESILKENGLIPS